jgi:hypothetical protein
MGPGAFGPDMPFQPVARGLGRHQRFLGREGFRCDDEQNGFRLDTRHSLFQVARIERGHKAQLGPATGQVQQGVRHKPRAEIRSADTDIDDAGNRLARRRIVSGPDRLREGARLRLGPVDELRFRGAGYPGAMPIGHVQGGTILGRVHNPARQELVALRFKTGFAGRLEERAECRLVQPLL